MNRPGATALDEDWLALPGGELVVAGISDLGEGRETVAALLVTIAAPRLRGVGLEIPPTQSRADPNLRLYEVLRESHGDGAHAHYNGLVGRIVSFANAADNARSR